MWGPGLRTRLRGPVLLAVGCGGIVTARSDTLEWALVQAYQNNPSLNAQRAALRGAYTQSYDAQPQGLRQTNVSILGQLTVPIYQGGAEYSAIRQRSGTHGSAFGRRMADSQAH
jgi:hypothetical protein